MHAVIRAFRLPKAGNSPSDFEDAFWPRKPLDSNSLPIRLAIADGATEASFSALWARLLVREYGLGHLSPRSLSESVAGIQSRWRRLVGREPLPWYAEEKLRDGAFSSLLGLTIGREFRGDESEGPWEAFAIGDSCLFQVRDGELIARFPLDQAELFDNRPVLVSTVASRNGRLDEALRVADGQWVNGDVFYLMTDALACWFLRRWELRSNPLFFLNEVQTQADFERLVDEQRADSTDDGARMLKNDDVTLVRCCLRNPE
jgi:hypothetical protein